MILCVGWVCVCGCRNQWFDYQWKWNQHHKNQHTNMSKYWQCVCVCVSDMRTLLKSTIKHKAKSEREEEKEENNINFLDIKQKPHRCTICGKCMLFGNLLFYSNLTRSSLKWQTSEHKAEKRKKKTVCVDKTRKKLWKLQSKFDQWKAQSLFVVYERTIRAISR